MSGIPLGRRKEEPNPLLCECHSCGAKACVVCDRPWHEGETCEDYQARIKDRVDEEDQSLSVIQKVAKACPSCKKLIEKDGGCSYMICEFLCSSAASSCCGPIADWLIRLSVQRELLLVLPE